AAADITTLNFTTAGMKAVAVNASNPTTGFDAVSGPYNFVVASGLYTYTINHFGDDDQIDMFDGAVVTVNPDTSNVDGEQSINMANSTTGIVTVINLIGLTNAQDEGLFNTASIDTVFGPNTLV
ncbi:hypothetical protein, partial [Chromatium okenii]|uniref:hypothetical protein n=1 Tax=Chromatium okenii TaxID=61644 RepID=UPI0026EDF4D9